MGRTSTGLRPSSESTRRPRDTGTRRNCSRGVALAEFSGEFKPYADPILMAMSELCYLSSFAKTLPEDMYSIQASVPQEHSSDWIEFMGALKQRGVFSSIQAFTFEWVRVVA